MSVGASDQGGFRALGEGMRGRQDHDAMRACFVSRDDVLGPAAVGRWLSVVDAITCPRTIADFGRIGRTRTGKEKIDRGDANQLDDRQDAQQTFELP